MTITQLLTYVALTAGILLYAALAVVPLVLEHEARKADRGDSTPTTRTSPTTSVPLHQHHLPHAA